MNTIQKNDLTLFASKAESYNNYWNNRIAWGAIIAGTIVSLGCETLLNFLGIGLGLASLNPKNPKVFDFETGTFIWIVLSGLVSMGIGGWFVGKFSNISCIFRRAYHGVIAWALAVFLTIVIAVSSSGIFMGGAINIINSSRIQELSQSEANVRSNNTQSTQELNSSTVSNQDKEGGIYLGNIGNVSILVFIAFLMSAIASILGSICGGSEKARKKCSLSRISVDDQV